MSLDTGLEVLILKLAEKYSMCCTDSLAAGSSQRLVCVSTPESYGRDGLFMRYIQNNHNKPTSFFLYVKT